MFIRLVLAAALALSASAALAQMNLQHISGTIKSMAPGHLVVTTDKGDIDLLLSSDTRFLRKEGAAASDIKPGSYLGTANQTVPEGGRANEVHLIDKGPNVNSPMNDEGLIMTNGHVNTVQNTAKGQEMDVDYGDGTRHVIVPTNTPITRLVSQDPSAIKAGAPVDVRAATSADGKLTARYVVLASAK